MTSTTKRITKLFGVFYIEQPRTDNPNAWQVVSMHQTMAEARVALTQ
jgi:hypothetical protein